MFRTEPIGAAPLDPREKAFARSAGATDPRPIASAREAASITQKTEERSRGSRRRATTRPEPGSSAVRVDAASAQSFAVFPVDDRLIFRPGVRSGALRPTGGTAA